LITDISTILLLPEKADIEFEQLAAAWTGMGGQVKRLGKFWIKDEEIAKHPIAIYGSQAFAMVLAQIYNLQLVSPNDAWIAELDSKWTKRTIERKQIGQLTATDFPIFIKPVAPKLFLAGIFPSISVFKEKTEGLDNTEEILVSSIVDDIYAEVRCFILDGEVKDMALYEGNADITNGESFVHEFIAGHKANLPLSVVVDIAYSKKLGWFVLEFNAPWGAGLNNCKAEKVLDCILAATMNGSL
jgi:ATP-grasp domain, R2K clade family 2